MAALAGGLITAGAGAEPVPVELVAGAAGIVATALASIRAHWLGLACAGLLVAGAVLGEARLAAIDAPRAVIGAGLRLEGQGVLLERPRPSPFGSSAEIELRYGEAAGARLVARAPVDLEWPGGASPGLELSVSGFARPPKADPEDDFDWPAYLRRQGVAGELDLETVSAGGARRGGFAGVLDGARRRAEDALGAGLADDQAALIRGMVLGQDERIDPLVRDDFRAAGLAHILAVSGQNVLLLSVLALPALAALGAGPRLRLAGLLGLIAVYVPLAGAGPSLQRAGVMGAAGVVALAAGRPAARWYALLLAAAITLGVNPRMCGDAGWQLSFAAVAGILLLAPGLRGAFRGLPRPLAEGVALTLSATVSTVPLLAHHFDQLSLAALPANLLALPAVAPAMWIGMVQIVLGQLGSLLGQLSSLLEPLGSLATALNTVLGAVNGVLLDYLGELTRRFAELPWAQVGLELASPITVAAAYAAIATGALLARHGARRASPRAAALGGWWRTAQPGARAAVALVAAVVLVAIFSEVTDSGAPPDRLTVSFLDVGQGDATLVQHPGGGTILIDGGPAEARVYRLVREAGVERLDLVVATHAAADHHGGLGELLGRVPVGLLLEGGDGTTDPDFNALLAEADRLGVERLAAQAGQVLRVGGLAVEVLAPEPRDPGPAPEDPNPRAVTVLVSAGELELLASGDAESPSLAPLELPDVDLLKVPHHGSSDDGLDEILARTRPEVAGIEVGADNGYGHPAPSTLAALDAAGAEVYRTDLDGTITVTAAGGELRVETER